MGHLKRFKEKHLKAPGRHVLLGVFSLAVLGALFAWQIVRAEGRVMRNVMVGGIDVGGLTQEEARSRLSDALRALNVSGIEFGHGQKSQRIAASEKSAAPAEQSLITYDLDAMVEEAFLAGSGGGRAGFIAANLHSFFAPTELPVRVAVNEEGLRALLRETFAENEQEARNADIVVEEVRRFDPASGSAGEAAARTEVRVRVIPETTGVTYGYDAAIAAAKASLERWQGGVFALERTEDVPVITTAKAELMREAVLDIYKKGAVTVGFDDQTWKIEGADLAKALTLKAHPDGSLYVGLRPETVRTLLSAAAKAIDQEPKGTRLVLNEERTRAVEFQGGQVGRKLDIEASVSFIDERLGDAEAAVIPLVVRVTSAPDSDAVAEEFGIRELIGWGTSDFTGSPANRKTNIKNGVDLLWGWLIAPGEEFGLIPKLRPFDASGGYVPELVIKGNRTIKEYGGGLCQIGTTAFRAVMGAGLPVTQRQNHSFRVRYYEPAGTDATLYDPAPDFKFVNDTGHHVLFITKMIGEKLRFELWGTRDGRVQYQSPVRIFNVTQPPEPKLIPTSALAPGERRCFENGYAGATTTFTYSVTYPDGTKKDQEFRSYYKPWQAQCLVGTAGAPNIRLQWDGSLKEFPPAGSNEEPKTVQVAPEPDQCSVGGCPG